MSPHAEQALDKLITLLERLLDRDTLEEHERMKIDLIHVTHQTATNNERIEKLEDAKENTGNLYVDDLKKKLKSQEDDSKHWVRYVVATTVALLLTIGAAALGYVARHP